jgi:hypothetical protein
VAEEKAAKAPAKREVKNVSLKYTGLPAGEHAGVGEAHGTIKIPESGNYETSDPMEQAFIQNVLGGVPKE